jgi:transcriptional regulator with XRE-family HTH domain
VTIRLSSIAATRDAAGPVGSRVTRARQDAGLSVKELSARLDLPLWRVEQIEEGGGDVHLIPAIAAATGKAPDWFLSDEGGDRADHPQQALDRSTRDRFVRRLQRSRSQPESPGFGASGARVAQARQEAGLSQKALAADLGLPLWRIERIERGDEAPGAQLGGIAARTGRDEQWFVEPAECERAAGEAATSQPTEAAPASGDAVTSSPLWTPTARRNLVLSSITLLVTIRFFTEGLHILPAPTKLVDIPLLVVLAIAAAIVPSPRNELLGFRYVAPAAVFLVIAFVSVLTNLGRVAPGPVLLFLYGFLAPVVVYVSVYRLWPAGNVLSLSRLLVALAGLQFLVVLLIDLPRFLGSRNPDVVSGTFGDNPYQLVWFLLVTAAVLAATYTFEGKRLAARLAPLFLFATLATILLAQYRALLFTMAVTALLVLFLLGSVRARGAVAGALVAVTFLVTLLYLSSAFPQLKYASTTKTLTGDPMLYLSKRGEAAGGIANLYSDDPRFMLTGTGPGTFSSRAWVTFADPTGKGDVGVGVKSRETRNQVYETDVSTKYVLPRLQRSEIIEGSRAVTTPYSSYLALLAEVGVFGFVVLMFIYGAAFRQVLRRTTQQLRAAAPQDPLPGLLLGCTVGFFILLQMGILGNWFEVTRLTFILWTLFAVVTKEVDARGSSAAPASLLGPAG